MTGPHLSTSGACATWPAHCQRTEPDTHIVACDLVRLAALTDDLYCVVGRDGRIARLNPAWERKLGRGLESLCARPLVELVHPDDRAATLAAIGALLGGDQVRHLRNRVQREDGTWSWLSWNLASDDEEALVYAVGRDVTDLMAEESQRREAQAKAASAEKLLEAIRHVQRMAIAECEPGPLFDFLLAQVLAITGSACGFIGEVLEDEGRSYVHTFALTNLTWDDTSGCMSEAKAPTGQELRDLEGLIGAVLNDGQPLIADDPMLAPLSVGLPEGHPELHAFLGLPLSDGEGLVGMLGVANRPGGYDEETVRFLEPLTTSAARLIRSYKGRRERERASDELRRSEQRWRRSIELAAHPVLLFDARRTITYANRALLELYGGGRGDLLGRGLDELIEDGDADHGEALERMRKDGWKHRLSQLRSAGGKRIPVELHAVDLGDGIYQGMIVDMREWVSIEAQLRQASQRDNLTGLLNRGAIEEHAEVEIHRARRRATPLSLLLVDVDHFKRINDRHGHLVGDAALRGLSKLIQDNVRPYDWVGRWGGEEILVVLPETTEEQALEVGERIRAAVGGEPLVTNTSAPLPVTVSVGVAGVGVGYTPTLRGLFERVDRALIMAKQSGRNRVVVYQDSTTFRRFPAALPIREPQPEPDQR